MNKEEAIKKGNEYIFKYSGNAEIFKDLNGSKCTVCDTYLGQNYVGIKFPNGIEITAYSDELEPI